MARLRSGLSLVCCVLLTSSGCGWAKRKPYGNDPLIRHQKPVVGVLPAKPTGSATAAEPYPPPRPVLPADPSLIRGNGPALRELIPPLPDAVASTPAASPSLGLPPVQYVPASAPRMLEDAATQEREVLPLPRAVPEPVEPSRTIETISVQPPITVERSAVFDRAADYRWLQGPLDVHHRGFLALRYCDASQDDRWGGKVRLADDDRLKEFADGDVLRVEGAIEAPPADGKWPEHAYPLFRITSVELVRKTTASVHRIDATSRARSE